MEIEEIIGRNLSEELINFMIKHRVKEYGENTKDFKNNEQESTFFFLRDSDGIKAFGTLKPVKIYYGLEKCEIMGIGNVLAVEKSKGYGTILMNHIRGYLEKNKYACIGNTCKTNFEFYKKCGFIFVPGLVDRFVYIDEDGKRGVKQNWADYDIFVYDQHNKFKEMINGKNEIIIKVPLW